LVRLLLLEVACSDGSYTQCTCNKFNESNDLMKDKARRLNKTP
jgi:hypothetical protein